VIGDELLIGQVTDTNSGMIARTIAPYGWSVRGVQTVGDNGADITRAIDEAFGRTDVVITTGGLGPTKDDLTKQVLCDYFGGTLVEDPSVTENILRIFERRGIKLNALTAAQALVPTSCRVIQNLVGTAPIMWFERADGKVLVAMPGVPFETRTMLDDAVLPALLEKFPS
ncbi:competence/damage-inducible protein A, partial [Klebsiella pneumoniae]|nr:competence/damage-inducible protein A [Klebsiella pneumoniae]